MASNADTLRTLLTRQNSELEAHVSSYIQVENELQEHVDGVNYAELETTAKTAFTKKKNELAKQIEEVVHKIEGIKRRIATTKGLIEGPQPQPRAPARLPTLPKFRGDCKDAVKDAFEFLDHCKSLLEANQVPEARWLSAIVTALTSTDRQWAVANLSNMGWEELQKEFLAHFRIPCAPRPVDAGAHVYLHEGG